MAKKIWVFSTLSNDNAYTEYTKGGSDLPIATRSVLIKGGTGVTDARLVTPQGVATEVSGDELALLEANTLFQLHKKNGFIKVEEGDERLHEDDIVAATEGMSHDDPSRQTVVADFEADRGAAEQAPTPTTGKSGKPSKK